MPLIIRKWNKGGKHIVDIGVTKSLAWMSLGCGSYLQAPWRWHEFEWWGYFSWMHSRRGVATVNQNRRVCKKCDYQCDYHLKKLEGSIDTSLVLQLTFYKLAFYFCALDCFFVGLTLRYWNCGVWNYVLFGFCT